jgi:hypothetical protein
MALALILLRMAGNRDDMPALMAATVIASIIAVGCGIGRALAQLARVQADRRCTGERAVHLAGRIAEAHLQAVRLAVAAVQGQLKVRVRR